MGRAAGAVVAAAVVIGGCIGAFNAWRDIRVIDGDTVRQGTTAYRLVGFNAPEVGSHAKCAAERGLGDAATAALAHIVSLGVEMTEIPCACPPSTLGTNRCNFGRRCAAMTYLGKPVGDLLVADGLAVPFRCGETSCPTLPRPWCQP